MALVRRSPYLTRTSILKWEILTITIASVTNIYVNRFNIVSIVYIFHFLLVGNYIIITIRV